jgi:hypothetical protein
MTASPTHFAKPPVIAAPATDEECNALREWAQNTPLVAPPPATTEQLARHLAFMAAALPSKSVDDVSGKMRVAVYASLLSGYTNAALAFMARAACQTLDWFPTPRQCLDLIAGYRPPVSDQETALRLCQDYTSGQFDRWMTNLADGQPIGSVPEHWKRIAVEQGALRRLSDGSFVSRALYHGPSKPWSVAA